MSLIKSFNISYLKENIKKSRGIIILLIILIPLFTTLNTIININGTEEYIYIPEKEWIGNINLYGMYIIPILLSFLLFGYVYKKNSVDLINSMPINRKSIFITNTVIGIVLITIIQILTAIALLLCNHFLENIYIYTGAIVDLFILMWVSYTFVFVATNLAMTLSGTFPTQILLTVLILMLVPFLVDSYNDFSNQKEYEFIVENSQFISFVENDDEFTLPYKYLKNNGYYDYEHEYIYEIYNTMSIIKMASLSLIYFVVGVYLFQKRKMENCEEAFSKVNTHLFVKALTILPIMILLNMNEENRTIIFNLCIISFYYYIYDFIFRRKVGLKTSIVGLILTIIILQATCVGINYLKDNKEMPKIRIKDIEEIAISSDEYYNSYYALNILDIASGTEHFVKNNELINAVLKGAANVQTQVNQYEEELERYNNNEIDYMSTYVDNTRYINVIFKLNNGKNYKTNLSISEFDFENIIKIMENDNNYKSKVLAELEKDDKILVDGILFNEEIQNNIKNEIKNKINSINKEQMHLDGNLGYITKYYYENHKLVSKQLCAELTPEMLNLYGNGLNKDAIYELKNTIENDEYQSFYIDLSNEPMWYGVNQKYFEFQRTKEKIIDLILEEQEFDANKSFYKLEGTLENGKYIAFFTNKVDEIDNIIQLEVEKNQNYYWEYEYELQKYYKSDWLFENYYVDENM